MPETKEVKKRHRTILSRLASLGTIIAVIGLSHFYDLLPALESRINKTIYSSYVTVVYQPQNLSLIETALEDEVRYYTYAENAETCDKDCGEKAVEVFKETVKPELEDILIEFDIILPDSEPEIAYVSAYVPNKNLGYYPAGDKILVPPMMWSNLTYSPMPEEGIAIGINHEYMHFIEDKLLAENDTGLDFVVNEGLARGITDMVARELYTETGNPDFLAVEPVLIANELSTVYQEMCRMYGIEPREELIIQGYRTYPYEAHTLGTALFKIAELRHGDIIYAKVLSGDYSILLDDTPDDTPVQKTEVLRWE